MVIGKAMCIIFLLRHFSVATSSAFVSTLTRIDSSLSLASVLRHSCMVKVAETRAAYSQIECSVSCSTTPACSIASYSANSNQCALHKPSDCCKTEAVQISVDENQNPEIWMDLKKSVSLDTNEKFCNSSIGWFGDLQTMRITKTGCYNVTSKGARSGRQEVRHKDGCLGAVKGGSFMFNASDELRIVVGQEGGSTPPGGSVGEGSGAGGASFVFTKSGDLLLAAGGAGGVAVYKGTNCSGQAGLEAGESWYSDSFLAFRGYGGENGTTGEIGPAVSNGNDGGVGASWFSSGLPVRAGEIWGGRPGHNLSGNFYGGIAPPYNLSTYGLFEAHGGFGGGGSGSPHTSGPDAYGNGGSGGGYSSGGVGSRAHTGGGGSSFASPMATNVWGITGGNTEAHGSVTFTYTGPTCG